MSSNTEYPKVCSHCGTTFIAKKLSTQFCSHRCSSLAYKQKKREQRVTIAKVEVKNSNKPPIIQQKISQQFKPSDNILPTLITKEYLNVAETAKLIGVDRATAYRYCTSGKLKCIKMNRKIFIRRSDIEELFNAAPRYEVTPRNRESSGVVVVEAQAEERQEQTTTPITDYISAREAAELFGVTKDAIHSRARTNKVPSVMFQKSKLYSRSHLEELYKRDETHDALTQWYSVDEIVEHYKMSRSQVYGFVSDHKVPKKSDGGKTIYSKTHVDELLKSRIGDTSIESWYTVEELYECYGLKPSYIANFVYTNKIPKRRINGRGEYSKADFDRAIKERNPPTVYLKVEDAAKAFRTTTDRIHYLTTKHNLPKIKEERYIRVQKIAIEKIINQ